MRVNFIIKNAPYLLHIYLRNESCFVKLGHIFFFLPCFYTYYLLFIFILGCALLLVCLGKFINSKLSTQSCLSICHRVKLVRLGHPARLLPQVLDSALDAQVHNDSYLEVLIILFVLCTFCLLIARRFTVRPNGQVDCPKTQICFLIIA